MLSQSLFFSLRFGTFGILTKKHEQGTPRGLNASHNFIESDSSPTRDDLYLTGDAWTLNLTKFQNWYDMSTDGTFGMDVMAQFAANRYHESVATNPNFYYGPFTGAIARNAGYIFSGRLFRNHSIENPAGVLSVSFFLLRTSCLSLLQFRVYEHFD
jgi:hypothetical protein